jgi:hypothetical protein
MLWLLKRRDSRPVQLLFHFDAEVFGEISLFLVLPKSKSHKYNNCEPLFSRKKLFIYLLRCRKKFISSTSFPYNSTRGVFFTKNYYSPYTKINPKAALIKYLRLALPFPPILPPTAFKKNLVKMRAEISQSLSKVVKYMFVIYVATSLIYTARHLYTTYSAGANDNSLHRPTIQRDTSPISEHAIEVKKETRLEKQIVWVNEQGIKWVDGLQYLNVYET